MYPLAFNQARVCVLSDGRCRKSTIEIVRLKMQTEN